MTAALIQGALFGYGVFYFWWMERTRRRHERWVEERATRAGIKLVGRPRTLVGLNGRLLYAEADTDPRGLFVIWWR